MRLTEVISERDEALERETATAEVLQVINSSPGDLKPVFDAMLEKALRLCEAAFGALHTCDGELVHTVALRNVPLPFAEFLTKAPLRPDPRRSLLGKCIYERRTIHIADRAAEDYAEGLPLAVAAVELGGIRALLHVPLIKDSIALGAFTIYRREVRPFSDKQIALLQNFAAQAVIAMENARLITETREALEQQKASAEILGVISTSVANTKPVFDKILDSCKHLFGGDELDVLLVDDDGLLQIAAYVGKAHEAVAATFPAPVDITPAGRAIRERRVVHYPDVLNDPETPRVLRRMGQIVGYHSLAFAPMVWEGRGIGAIGVARSRGAFTERDWSFCRASPTRR